MGENLATIFSNYQGKREEVIPLLQDVQGAHSFLSEDAMLEISRFTKVPPSQVYAVATFYAQFRFEPRGEKHIMVCRGTACHVSGAPRVLEDIETELGIKEGQTSDDLKYSLETVACIGACSLAPCIMVDKKVEAKMDKKKVQALFGKGKE
jgi:NADH-quinone oxidoreductase subunit E